MVFTSNSIFPVHFSYYYHPNWNSLLIKFDKLSPSSFYHCGMRLHSFVYNFLIMAWWCMSLLVWLLWSLKGYNIKQKWKKRVQIELFCYVIVQNLMTKKVENAFKCRLNIQVSGVSYRVCHNSYIDVKKYCQKNVYGNR